MLRKSLFACLCLALGASLASAADLVTAPASLSAAEIVDRNVAARGGLQAWRAVKTMTMMGKMGAGGNQRATLPSPVNRKAARQAVPKRPVEEAQLPFVMELARPRKMRLELQLAGQTAVQVYDGSNGWKLRPYLNRNVVEPFTADELKVAASQAELDGVLVDYAAKGTRIESAGVEKVDNRDNYKLKLTQKNGRVYHIWIDAQNFLETKMEGQPRQLDGVMHPVEIYFRDYRTVDGLKIPFVLETKVLPVGQTPRNAQAQAIPVETITVEKVTVNPGFNDALFAKPEVKMAAR